MNCTPHFLFLAHSLTLQDIGITSTSLTITPHLPSSTKLTAVCLTLTRQMRPDDKKDKEQARLEEEKQRELLTIRSAARAGMSLDDFDVVVKQVTTRMVIGREEHLDGQ